MYWRESGSLGADFRSCALNLTCSLDTVAAYMSKHGRDCNADGVVDCADYAAVHTAGPEHCSDDWVHQSPFMRAFHELSGRSAEASELTEARAALPSVAEFGRVVARRRPTPPANRRYSVVYVPEDHVHEILSALDPWILGTAPRRASPRRPASEQPPRRRRVRPHSADRSPATDAPVTPPMAPTRRRLRTTVAPAPSTSTATVTRRPPTEAPSTIP